MKKINKEGIRALILETLDEMSLGEAKKKEKVEEAGEDVKDTDYDTASGGGWDSHDTDTEADPLAAQTEGENSGIMQTVKGIQTLIQNAFDMLQKDTSKPVIDNAILQLKNGAKSLESHLPSEQAAAPVGVTPVQESKRRR